MQVEDQSQLDGNEVGVERRCFAQVDSHCCGAQGCGPGALRERGRLSEAAQNVYSSWLN